MVIKTPHKRVLFVRSLARLLLGGAVLVLALFSLWVKSPAQQVNAATSGTINFQARLMGAQGQLVADGNYHVEFKLYNASSSSGSSQGSCTGDAACLWAETRTTGNLVTVKNGYLTVNLGSVTPFPATIKWDQDLWLTMNIGGSGGTATWDGEMSPRLKLTAVPYAFRAGQLAKLTGANTSTLDFATQTAARSILLPDENGTLCIQSSTSCGFASSSGSGNYIQNGTAVQANANFAIQSAAAGSVGGVIRGAASQTADLLQVQNSAGTVLSKIDAGGRFRSEVVGMGISTGGNTDVSFDYPGTGNAFLWTANTGNLTIKAGGSGVQPLTVKAAVSQTADLLQLQSNTGTVLSKFDASGNLSVGTSTSPTGGVATFNGNVGIGTTSPASRLQIVGAGASSPILQLTTTGAGNREFRYAITGGGANYDTLYLQSNTVSGGSTFANLLSVQADGRVGVGYDASAPGASGTFNVNGNVGIGTNNPAYKLDVVGDARFGANGWLTAIDTGSGNGRLAVTNIGSVDFGGALLFRNNAGTTEYARITSVGNVGIGTPNPQQKLNVAGGNIAININTPGAPTLTAFATGGSLASGTYYYVITATDTVGFGGETVAGPESNVAVTGPTGSVSLSWAAVPGAGGYNVYRGTTSGGENVMYAVVPSATSFTDTGAAGTSASPPTVTTAYALLLGNDGSIQGSNLSLTRAGNPAGQYIKLTPATNAWGSTLEIKVGRNSGGFGGQYAIQAQTFDDPTLYPNQNTHVSINQAAGSAVNQNAVFYVGKGSNSVNTRPSAIFENAVGIGGVTPATGASQLAIKAQSGQTADLFQVQNSAGSVLSKFDASGNLSVGTSTSPTGGVATFNGNVGIGTTNPGYHLQVSGDGTGGSSTINALSTTGGFTGFLATAPAGQWSEFRATDGTNILAAGQSSGVGYLQTNNAIPLTFGTSNSEKMRILANGNVGVGTTNPQQALTLGSSRNFAVEMATPAAPTVTPTGTAGATSYSYTVTALDGVGETVASTPTTTTTGNATLSGTNYNAISWTAITGASSYSVYRTASGGTPATTGKIGTVTTTSLNDTGLAASGTSPSATTAYVNKLTASGNSWLLGGNVGIYTATPAAGLAVNATTLLGPANNSAYDIGAGRIAAGNSIYSYGTICSLNSQGDCGGSGGVVIRGDTTTNTAATVNITTGTSFFNGGNVGIGDTSPAALLTVGNGDLFQVASTGATTLQGGYGTNVTAANSFALGGGGASPNAGSLSFGDNTGWKFNIGTKVAGTFTPRVTFLDTGNVGIGTTGPLAKLHVSDAVGGSSNPLVQFSATSNDAKPNGLVYLTDSTSNNPATILNVVQGGTGYAATFTGGNVGIGTTAPTQKLEVYNGNIQASIGNLNTTTVTAPGAPTVAVNTTAGNLNGTYYYVITYLTANGQSAYGTVSAAVSPASQQVNLSAIPTGPTGVVTARKIYRTAAGGSTSGPFYLVTTINDNTTTTYTDNIADGSLGVAASNIDTSGGMLQVNGTSVLKVTTNSTFNTALGLSVLNANTTGDYNTGVGYQSLLNNTTGRFNTGLGKGTLQANTTGIQNIAIGVDALNANTTANNNIAIGAYSLQSNTTGYYNLAVGTSALQSNTTGFNNLALGASALYTNTTGYNNTALGVSALQFNTTGYNNIALGGSALQSNTAGYYNTAIGSNALLSNSTGYYNTAIGSNALQANTTGNNNVGLGSSALYFNTTGVSNTAIGGSTLYANTTGSNNTALGESALQQNTTGTQNTAIGKNSLFANTTGYYNTALGYQSLQANTTGTANTGLGMSALFNNTTGANNTASGIQALYSNTTGNGNAALGISSLYSNTTGTGNTALGYLAGYTSVGTNANTTGNYNTFVGYNSGPGTTTQLTNATAIGNLAVVSASNSLVLGSINGVNGATSSVNVGIGTATPAAPLQVTTAAFIQEGALTNAAGVSLGVQGTAPRISLDNGSGAANVAGYQWNIDNFGNAFRLFTAGSTKLIVDSTGNVGIGTTTIGTNNRLIVNPYSFVDNLATAQINTNAATNKGLVVQGFASQTADLLQLQNSAGTVLSKFDASGNLSVGTSTSPTGGVAYFNGNVGVKTQAPTASLEITHGSNTTNALKVVANFNSSIGGTQLGANFVINNASTSVSNTATSWATTVNDSTALGNILQGMSSTINDTGSGAKTLMAGIFDTSSSTNTAAWQQTLFAKGKSTIGGNILQIDNNIGTVLSVNSTGAATFTNSSNSTTALRVQNAAGTSFLTADSTNKIITSYDHNIGTTFTPRLFSDSFESGNFVFWESTTTAGTGAATVDCTVSRGGRCSAKFVEANSGNKAFALASLNSGSTVYARGYFQVTAASTPATYGNLLMLWNSTAGDVASELVLARNNSTGALCFASSTQTGSVAPVCSATTLPLSTWARLELKVTLASGANNSSYQIFKDGASILSGTFTTGTVTTIDKLYLSDYNGGANTPAWTMYADDLSVDTISTNDSANLYVADSLRVAGTASLGKISVGANVLGTKFMVNVPVTGDPLAQAIISSATTSKKALVVQGVASQTADLMQFQDSTGLILGAVKSNGYVGINNAGSSTVALLVQSDGTTDVATVIKAGASQTADLLQVQNSAGTVLSKFDASGNLSVGTATSPTGGVATFNGAVGIGTASPNRQLEVSATATPVARFNRSNDGSVVEFASGGVVQGDISIAGATTSYNAFTGSHYASLTGPAQKGELVSLTGTNTYLHNDPQAEIIYGVSRTAQENDPAVLGAFLARREPAQPLSNSNPDLVMAVGNGVMWVTDEGGNLAAGDYLISSAVAGHARKDPRSAAISYVVGRAAEPVDWSKVTETVAGHKHKLISVTFDVFSRDNSALRATDIQSALYGRDLSLGNLTVTGTLSVKSIVVGTLTINGHVLSSATTAPAVVKGTAAGRDALVSVEGTDTAGTITIKIKAHQPTPQEASSGMAPEVLTQGELTTLTFHTPFELAPRVVITPTNDQAVGLPVYVVKTNDGFKLVIKQAPTNGAEYRFDYIVVGAQTAAAP